MVLSEAWKFSPWTCNDRSRTNSHGEPVTTLSNAERLGVSLWWKVEVIVSWHHRFRVIPSRLLLSCLSASSGRRGLASGSIT